MKFIIAILFLVPSFAFAQTLMYAPTASTDYVIRYGDTSGNPISACQTFTGVEGSVEEIKVYLQAPNGTEGDTLTVGLQTAPGSVPSGTWLTYGTIDQDTLTGSFAQYTFTMSPAYDIDAGTEYCVVYETTGSGDSSSPARINVAGDTATIAGDLQYYDNIWNIITGTANIELWGSSSTPPTPSPTSTATSTDLQSIHYDLLWLLWLVAFICSFLWFERYYKT